LTTFFRLNHLVLFFGFPSTIIYCSIITQYLTISHLLTLFSFQGTNLDGRL